MPDIEGTKLLGEFKETTPKMIKIMLTGYPSMNNAIEAVNKRADAFFLKPVDFEVLLIKISELLALQDQAKSLTENALVNYIELSPKSLSQNRSLTSRFKRQEGHNLTKQITDKIILEAIDKGLSLLGENPKQALWYCLEKDFKFDRQKVPENLKLLKKV